MTGSDDKKPGIVSLAIRDDDRPPNWGVRAIGTPPAIGTPTSDTFKLTPKSDIDHCNPPFPKEKGEGEGG